jgi:hypothetical protein
MQKTNSHGSVGSAVITILLALALVGALVFAGWAFSGRQDYKNNSYKKAAEAVTKAKAAQATELQKQFDEQSKAPYKSYGGSPTYGSISFSYPKTWSAYVDETGSAEPLNAYFHPAQVPGLQSNTAYALRVELTNTAYSQVLQQLSSQITSGKLRAAAYIPPKMKGKANVQPGTRLDGAIGQNQQGALSGAMVVIKVRDKTLEVYTQSTNFLADFENIILPSLSFTP